jgi:hypothetical protein
VAGFFLGAKKDGIKKRGEVANDRQFGQECNAGRVRPYLDGRRSKARQSREKRAGGNTTGEWPHGWASFAWLSSSTRHGARTQI